MTAEHADFDALSAFVDGEAPEWADHVAGCAQCRATAADLRAMSATVAARAGLPAPAVREAAIAAALNAADLSSPAGTGAPAAAGGRAELRHEAQRARFERRRAPRPWAMPAVAAVVVGLLGVSGFVLSSNRSTDENATVAAGSAADSKAEFGAPVGDLGDVTDAATLRARALGVTPAASGVPLSGRSSSSSNSGVSSDATASGSPQPSATNTGNTGSAVSSGGVGGAGGAASAVTSPPQATSGASAAAGPAAAGGSSALNAPGTRPCEQQVRAREPGLGVVTYFATARRGAVPAYVLGFSSPSGTVTLLMLAQDGCSELLRSAGP